MNRPKHWDELPHCIAETIADSSPLRYDHFESSHVEALWNLMCDPFDRTKRNWDVVQSKYVEMSDPDLNYLISSSIEAMQRQLSALKDFQKKV